MNVYLLAGSDQFSGMVKIGKANNIRVRKKTLEAGGSSFDAASSYVITCMDANAALRVEAVLHGMFHRWNVQIPSIRARDGGTEWFFISCLGDVLEFVIAHQSYLLCSIPYHIDGRGLVLPKTKTNDLGFRALFSALLLRYARIKGLMPHRQHSEYVKWAANEKRSMFDALWAKDKIHE